MKIRNSLAILCSAAFCFALALSGCKNKNSTSSNPSSGGGDTSSGDTSGGSQQVWTVTFDTQGGSTVAAQKVKNGQTATKPADPTKANFTFKGWFEEAGAVTPFDFTTKITTNWTIYAGWTAQSVVPPGPDDPNPPTPTTYDYYVTVGTQEFGLTTSANALATDQTGEWTANLGSVTAGQEVVVKNADKVALSENFGAEPGDNNVTGEVGNFTIHNDAANAIILVKTWQSGWTNFYISGYSNGGTPDPQPGEYAYYIDLAGTEIGLSVSPNTLVENQTGEWKAELGNVTAGQSVVIKNSSKVALSDSFGAEPGDNNVSGSVGSFTIHNDAENAFVLVKTWQSGWTNFYISGYEAPAAPTPHGPEGSVAVEWFIVGQGNTALFPNSWSWEGAIQLYTNPGSTDIGCIFGVTFTEGDLFKLFDAHSNWVGFNSLLSSSPCYSCFEGSAGIGSDPNIKCKTTVVCNVFYTAEGKIYITPYVA